MEVTTEQLIILIEQTFSNANAQERKEVERTLTTLSQDLEKLTKMILSILSSNDGVKEFTKEAACLILENSFRTQINLNNLSPEQTLATGKLVIDAISGNGLAPKLRELLARTINLLLTSKENEDFLENVYIFADQMLYSEKISDWMTGFIIHDSMTKLWAKTNISDAISKNFSATLKLLVKVGDTILSGAFTEIQNFVKSGENKAAVKMGADYTLKMISTVESFILNLIPNEQQGGKKNAKKNQMIADFLGLSELSTLLQKILILNIPNQAQLQQNIFSTSGIEELDSILNKAKASVLKILTRFLEYIIKTPQLETKTLSKSIITDIFQGVLQSVLAFCKGPVADSNPLSNDAVEGLMYQCLNYLTKIVAVKSLYQVFFDLRKTIIIDICLVLMRVDEQEIDLFKNNPDEFVGLAMDTCDRQQSETAKTQAAQFLEVICDDIDGCLSMAVIFAATIIDYTLVSDNIHEIDYKFPILTDHKDSVLLSKTQGNTRADVCLLLFGVLSYHFSKRQDLCEIIKKLAQTYHPFFFKDAVELLRTRYYCILMYLGDVIFAQNEPLSGAHLSALVEALQGQEATSLSLMALETLQILYEEEQCCFTQEHTIDALWKFADIIPYSKQPKLFDLILEIINKFSNAFSNSDSVTILLKALTARLNTEAEDHKQGKGGSKHIENKVWNILRKLADSELFVARFSDQFLELISIVIPYLESSDEEVNWFEDLADFITGIIKARANVPDIIWAFFKMIPANLKKQNYILGSLFQTLNQIIVNGADTLKHDNEAVEILVQMGLDSIIHAKRDSDAMEGIFLLQLILQYSGDVLPNWKVIIEKAIEFAEKTDKKFMKAKYAGILYLSFMKSFSSTQEFLLRSGLIGKALELMVGDLTIYSDQSYDRKVMVLGGSHLLIQEELSTEISQNLPKIFEAIVSVLIFTTRLEKLSKKKQNDDDDDDPPKLNKLINLEILKTIQNDTIDAKGFEPTSAENKQKKERQVVSDDEYEDDEEEEKDDEDEDEAEIDDDRFDEETILNHLVSNIKSIDEFIRFKESVIRIKEINHGLLKKLVDGLSEFKKNSIKQIVNSKRVDSNSGSTHARRIIRVKGLKSEY